MVPLLKKYVCKISVNKGPDAIKVWAIPKGKINCTPATASPSITNAKCLLINTLQDLGDLN